MTVRCAPSQPSRWASRIPHRSPTLLQWIHPPQHPQSATTCPKIDCVFRWSSLASDAAEKHASHPLVLQRAAAARRRRRQGAASQHHEKRCLALHRSTRAPPTSISIATTSTALQLREPPASTPLQRWEPPASAPLQRRELHYSFDSRWQALHGMAASGAVGSAP